MSLGLSSFTQLRRPSDPGLLNSPNSNNFVNSQLLRSPGTISTRRTSSVSINSNNNPGVRSPRTSAFVGGHDPDGGGARRGSVDRGGHRSSTSSSMQKSGKNNRPDGSPAGTALTTTQADAHRRAQAIHYPGYHQARVHALPTQNEKRVDHLYIADLVLNMNKENLTRFGVRKEMRQLLHKRSMQKFLLDTFWWFFLDCFSNVNFDGMVARAQSNHLVSDAEMRAYVKSGTAVDSAKVAKNELGVKKGKKRGAMMFGEDNNDSGGEADGEDGDDDDGQALVAAHLAAPKRPVQQYLRSQDLGGDSDDEGGAQKKPKKRKGGKEDPKLTIEDYAPPTHLNALKPKNRRAEDVAHIGSPSYTNIDELYSVVRANSELSEWSDSDASTTSFVQPNFGGSAPASAGSQGEGTLDLKKPSPPPSRGQVGFSSSGGGGTLTSQLSETMGQSSTKPGSPGGVDFTETTCPRVRSVASSVLRVGKFLPMTYQLHKLDPAARASVVTGQQHQLFTRMANNYGSTIQKLSRRLHHTLKDGLTRLLPDIMSQILFVCFSRAIPFGLEMFDDEFQIHLWSTLSFWTGGVHRHGNNKGWPIHVLVDPVLAHRAELKAMNAALEETALNKMHSNGGRRGSHFSLGSGSSKTTVRPHTQQNLVPACATRTTRSSSKANLLAATGDGDSTHRGHKPRPPPSTARPATSGGDGSNNPPTRGSGVVTSASAGSVDPTTNKETSSSTNAGTLPGLGEPKKSTLGNMQRRTSDGEGTPGTGKESSSNNQNMKTGGIVSGGGGGAKKSTKNKLSLIDAVNRPKFDAVGAFLAPNSRAQWMVNRDVELMKTELHRLRTTHTFSQSHYTPNAGGGGDPSSPTGSAPSSPTRSRSGGSKKGPTSDSGGDAAHDGIVKRTMYTYNIQTKKRTVQVIKAELDAKYKDHAPWYGNSRDRVAIKEQLGATKFSVKNWSPLVHRFMLQSGRDNGLPSDGMTWTM